MATMMVGIADVRSRLHAITGGGMSGCDPSHSCATPSLSHPLYLTPVAHNLTTSQSQMNGPGSALSLPHRRCPTRSMSTPCCPTLAPSPSHLLSHPHVSLPYRLTHLTRAAKLLPLKPKSERCFHCGGSGRCRQAGGGQQHQQVVGDSTTNRGTTANSR